MISALPFTQDCFKDCFKPGNLKLVKFFVLLFYIIKQHGKLHFFKINSSK